MTTEELLLEIGVDFETDKIDTGTAKLEKLDATAQEMSADFEGEVKTALDVVNAAVERLITTSQDTAGLDQLRRALENAASSGSETAIREVDAAVEHLINTSTDTEGLNELRGALENLGLVATGGAEAMELLASKSANVDFDDGTSQLDMFAEAVEGAGEQMEMFGEQTQELTKAAWDEMFAEGTKRAEDFTKAVEDAIEATGGLEVTSGDLGETYDELNDGIGQVTRSQLVQERYADRVRESMIRQGFAVTGLNTALGGLPQQFLAVNNQMQNMEFAAFRLTGTFTNLATATIPAAIGSIGTFGVALLVLTAIITGIKFGGWLNEVLGLQHRIDMLMLSMSKLDKYSQPIKEQTSFWKELGDAIHKSVSPAYAFLTAMAKSKDEIEKLTGATKEELQVLDQSERILRNRLLAKYADDTEMLAKITGMTNDELVEFVGNLNRVGTAANNAAADLKKITTEVAKSVSEMKHDYEVGLLKPPQQLAQRIKDADDAWGAYEKAMAAAANQTGKAATEANKKVQETGAAYKKAMGDLYSARSAAQSFGDAAGKAAEAMRKQYEDAAHPLEALARKWEEARKAGVTFDNFITAEAANILKANTATEQTVGTLNAMSATLRQITDAAQQKAFNEFVKNFRSLSDAAVASGAITSFQALQKTVAALPAEFEAISNSAGLINPAIAQVVAAIQLFTQEEQRAAAELQLRIALQEMPVQFQALAVALSLANPAFSAFVEMAVKATNPLETLADAVEQMRKEILAATNPTNLFIAAMKNLTEAAKEQAKIDLAKAFENLALALLLIPGPLGMVVLGLLAAADAAKKASKELTTLDKIAGGLSLAMGIFGGTFDGIISSVINGIGTFKENVKELGTTKAVFAGIGAAARQLGQAIGGTAGQIVSGIGAIVESFATMGPVAGIITAVTVAFGFLLKLFQKNWGKIVQDQINAFLPGLKLSADLMKRLAEEAKKYGNAMVAVFMNLRAIMDDVGVSAANVETLIGELRNGFSLLQDGLISTEQLTSVLSDTFDDLAKASMGATGIISNSMREIISLARQAGLEIEAITNFLESQLMAGVQGFSLMFEHYYDRLQRYYEKNKDQIKEWLKGNFESPKEAVMFGSFQFKTQNQLDRQSNILLMWVNAMLAQGMSLDEIMQAVGTDIDHMVQLAKEFGLNLSPALQTLIDLRKESERWGPILQGVNAQLVAMANVFETINPANFYNIIKDARGIFKDILKDGKLTRQEFLAIMPLLLTMIQMSQQFGIKLPGWVTDIITRAQTKGWLPKDLTVKVTTKGEFKLIHADLMKVDEIRAVKGNIVNDTGTTQGGTTNRAASNDNINDNTRTPGSRQTTTQQPRQVVRAEIHLTEDKPINLRIGDQAIKVIATKAAHYYNTGQVFLDVEGIINRNIP